MVDMLNPNSLPELLDKDLNLYRLATIGDGNCFLHAISGSCIEEYQEKIWTEEGKIKANAARAAVKKLRGQIFEKAVTQNDYMDEDTCIEFLQKLFGDYPEEFIYHGKTNEQRLVKRVFDIFSILGKPIEDEDEIIRGFEGVVGIKEESDGNYFVRYPGKKYKLVDYTNNFDPLIHLNISDQRAIFREFSGRPVEDFGGIYTIAISRGFTFFNGNNVDMASFDSVLSLAGNGNFQLLFSEVSNLNDTRDFFNSSEYFKGQYIPLVAYTLNVNIIILNYTMSEEVNKAPVFYPCFSRNRPWSIIALVGDPEGGHYETVGIEENGVIRTYFEWNRDNQLLTSFLRRNPPESIETLKTIFKL